MQIYCVGGAIRDQLLGLPVEDHDYVVTGSTPQQMIAAGFIPVGKDFPVFLHPKTKEEYALARTERKTAPGYQGFIFHTAPNITLEQDLERRDLTINAIAQTADGQLIDPFGGCTDLRAKIFRHVSPTFAEDPVRLLRLARFAARFPDFQIAPETQLLIQTMVQSGEIDALVQERVWQELARGLMAAYPSRMFEVLQNCGALARLLPEIAGLWKENAGENFSSISSSINANKIQSTSPPPPRVSMTTPSVALCALKKIDYAAKKHFSLPIRFAVLLAHLEKTRPLPEKMQESSATRLAETVCEHLGVPKTCRALAILTVREQNQVRHARLLSAADIVALLERCDAFRKPERFQEMLKACECVFFEDNRTHHALAPETASLFHALHTARAVDAGKIAQSLQHHPDAPAHAIPAAIHAARVHAVQQALQLML